MLIVIQILSFLTIGNTNDSSYIMKGDSLSKIGDYVGAYEYYKLGLSSLSDQPEKYVRILNRLAHISSVYLDDFNGGYSYLEQAKRILTQNDLITDTTRALTFYTYGIYFNFCRDPPNPDSALFYHKKALRLRKSFLQKNDINIAKSYKGVGNIYRYMYYDYSNAEDYYVQSLKILESGDASYQKSAGSTHYSLSTTNRLKGDYSKALLYAYKTLSIYSK
ncbi:MAG: tetratricopeptide repeat protein [Bacteroidota bacterium]